MSKGGKREGAGPKPRSDVNAKNHTIRFTDQEWKTIKEKAKLDGINPSDYIRKKSLEQ